jgi:HisJ family histidinol phosphate phosphatase
VPEPERDPRLEAIPDVHGHAKGEHKPFAEERPIPYTARVLFLWFYHACRRGSPRFMMVSDHINYLTFEDPAAVNLVRRALKLAHAGDLYGAAETAGVEVMHAQAVSEGLRRGMRYSIGAEVDNDPRNRPDAQNIVDAMRPDAIIRSIHFLTIDHPEHGAGWQWPFDNPEFEQLYESVGTEKVWELYMAALLEAIEKLPGHIVGHFYVPAKFGHWPDDETLERYEDQLLDACAERGMAIEINTRAFYRSYAPDEEAQRRKYREANLRLLRKAKAKGIAIAIGSDAHSPRDQGGGFDIVLEMLDAAEVNEIAFPVNGRMARVALRATEEILEQQRAAVPEPQIGSSVSGLSRADIAARQEEAPEPEAAAPAKPPAKKKRPPAKRAAEAATPVAAATEATPAGPDADASAPVAEPKPKARPKPRPKAAPQAIAETDASSAPPPDLEPGVVAAKDSEPSPGLEPAPVSGVAAEPAADAKPKAEPKPKAQRKAKAEPKAAIESERTAEPEAAAEPKPKAEPKPRAEPKPMTQAAAAAQPKAAAEPKASPAPKAAKVPKPAPAPRPIAVPKPPAKPKAVTKPAAAKTPPKAAAKAKPVAKKQPAKPAAKPAAKAAAKAKTVAKKASAKAPAKKAAPVKAAPKRAAAKAPVRPAATKAKVAPARAAAKKKTTKVAAKPAKRAAPGKRPAAKKPAAKAPAKKKPAKPRR